MRQGGVEDVFQHDALLQLLPTNRACYVPPNVWGVFNPLNLRTVQPMASQNSFWSAQVVVRVRPLSSQEITDGREVIVRMDWVELIFFGDLEVR